MSIRIRTCNTIVVRIPESSQSPAHMAVHVKDIAVLNQFYQSEVPEIILNHFDIRLGDLKISNITDTSVELLTLATKADFYMPIGNRQAITGGTKITNLDFNFDVNEVGFLARVVKGNFNRDTTVITEDGEIGRIQSLFGKNEPAPAVLDSSGEPLRLDFSIEQIAVYVKYHSGRFGVGVKGLSMSVSSEGSNLNLDLALHKIFLSDIPTSGSTRDILTSPETKDLLRMKVAVANGKAILSHIFIFC